VMFYFRPLRNYYVYFALFFFIFSTNLLSGSTFKRANLLQNENFISFSSGKQDSCVSALYRDSSFNVWVGESDGTLTKFDSSIFSKSDKKEDSIPESELVRTMPIENVNGDEISVIVEYDRDKFLIAIKDEGLFHYKNGKTTPFPNFQSTYKNIVTITMFNNLFLVGTETGGVFLIGRDGKVERKYDIKGVRRFYTYGNFDQTLSFKERYSTTLKLKINEGRIVVATDNGVYFIHDILSSDEPQYLKTGPVAGVVFLTRNSVVITDNGDLLTVNFDKVVKEREELRIVGRLERVVGEDISAVMGSYAGYNLWIRSRDKFTEFDCDREFSLICNSHEITPLFKILTIFSGKEEGVELYYEDYPSGKGWGHCKKYESVFWGGRGYYLLAMDNGFTVLSDQNINPSNRDNYFQREKFQKSKTVDIILIAGWQRWRSLPLHLNLILFLSYISLLITTLFFILNFFIKNIAPLLLASTITSIMFIIALTLNILSTTMKLYPSVFSNFDSDLEMKFVYELLFFDQARYLVSILIFMLFPISILLFKNGVFRKKEGQ